MIIRVLTSANKYEQDFSMKILMGQRNIFLVENQTHCEIQVTVY